MTIAVLETLKTTALHLVQLTLYTSYPEVPYVVPYLGA